MVAREKELENQFEAVRGAEQVEETFASMRKKAKVGLVCTDKEVKFTGAVVTKKKPIVDDDADSPNVLDRLWEPVILDKANGKVLLWH